ncbi:MAG: hypothetical protein QOD53_2541, partial [Thermoleophilaceae bacterium]|nr:hypothetical protein [Thermoleophilaceae bacterium]
GGEGGLEPGLGVAVGDRRWPGAHGTLAAKAQGERREGDGPKQAKRNPAA